ncbi:hypothetical protein [Bradyrhizobium sp. SZCCHNR3118]|uniref:hypothetical protein n=1 Tax=Bradyrhizobium sp. SZCCHNR3118 TaxID=3057468 RepID=UPI002916B41E|nr:hypothetical protein [Bradyrhizobium sp. SZCCHNR3118]
MKEFTVIKDFWRNGILQPAGKVIRMVEAEAKYLGHVVQEGVKAVEAEVAKDVAAVKSKVQGAVVTEAPQDGASN